jgi:hypothetical protein
MLRGVELIFVTKHQIIILSIVELTVVKGVHVAIRVRYSEPRLNH